MRPVIRKKHFVFRPENARPENNYLAPELYEARKEHNTKNTCFFPLAIDSCTINKINTKHFFVSDKASR